MITEGTSIVPGSNEIQSLYRSELVAILAILTKIDLLSLKDNHLFKICILTELLALSQKINLSKVEYMLGCNR